MTPRSSQSLREHPERGYRYFSTYMTTVGLLHFVFPRLWDRLTVLVSPEHASDWTFRIGLSETVFGAMTWHRRTRWIGATGLIVQCIALVVRFFYLRRTATTAEVTQ